MVGREHPHRPDRSSLVVLYARGLVFSPTAYALMAVLLYMHTIGGHYTSSASPSGS